MSEQLKIELGKFETEHHLVYNTWKAGGNGTPFSEVNGKDELIKKILSRYEERNGLWREKGTGQRVSITDVIAHELKQPGSRSFIRNKDLFSRYVSPFKPRSADTLQRHAAQVSKLVGTQISKLGLVFISQEAKKKTIDIISQNFLPVDTPEGLKYHRVSSEGIPSTEAWTFEQIASSFRLSRFIDEDRTVLSQMVFESNLKAEAMKLSGTKSEEDYVFKQTLERLKKVDAPTAGKTLQVDGYFIQNELEKQATLETNFLNPTLDQRNQIKIMVQSRMESLNSISNLEAHFNEITIEEPSTWDGI